MNVQWLGRDQYFRLVGEDYLDEFGLYGPQILTADLKGEIERIFYRGCTFVGP